MHRFTLVDAHESRFVVVCDCGWHEEVSASAGSEQIALVAARAYRDHLAAQPKETETR